MQRHFGGFWNRWMVGVVWGLAGFWVASAVWAEVRLPKILGDNMVMQQQTEVRIWGWADPDEEVTVQLQEQKVSTKADTKGRWLVKLRTPEAGGPYEVHVIGKTNHITLRNVLVGEVWVASGQSNMQWPVSRSDNAQQEIAAAKYPKIRFFTVPQTISDKPLDDWEKGAWVECSPETVAGFSAVAYFFGRHLHQELGVPVGLINSSWGGTICEAWTSLNALQTDEDFKPILERAKQFNPKNPNQPAVLFNGMIHPLLPFVIRGAIWYQGESNVGRAAQYKKLFPIMIQDWRHRWQIGDFPFYYVQLAPFQYGNRVKPECLPELWEAQLQTLRLPNTGMVVTTDIGNIKDIHPTNKQEVGRRLALWALAKIHGKSIVYSGPLYDGYMVEGNKIRIKFRYAEEGLVCKGDRLIHFSIAGEDGKFVPADAIIDGSTVVVSSPQIAKPVAVRFGWVDTAEPNLFNKAGLPASPFRTDTFPMVTEGNK
ncbi:MAG: sialate O-acetylesterase [Thermoguttaceae bacterium]|nr:sialate O-acetylesterase [Thermoguttaceae bacterium]MDW8036417.1 sialate O-acetylesterase [Thermoguttaceae bacterium]